MFDQIFLRFVLVGILNTLIGYTVIMILFHLIGLSYARSYLLSYIIGIIISFFLNRKFVFFSKKNRLLEFFKFLIAFVISYSLSYLSLSFIVKHQLINTDIAFFIGMAIYSTLFYLLNRYITFAQISK